MFPKISLDFIVNSTLCEESKHILVCMQIFDVDYSFMSLTPGLLLQNGYRSKSLLEHKKIILYLVETKMAQQHEQNKQKSAMQLLVTF